MAAIFDLLFSQCDRNPQNFFLNSDGNIMYIDNDQTFGTAWRKCGVDSLILPTTQKYEINRLGYFYVMKYPPDNPPQNREKTKVRCWGCGWGWAGRLGPHQPAAIARVPCCSCMQPGTQEHWCLHPCDGSHWAGQLRWHSVTCTQHTLAAPPAQGCCSRVPCPCCRPTPPCCSTTAATWREER
jgi:hypothetical protein